MANKGLVCWESTCLGGVLAGRGAREAPASSQEVVGLARAWKECNTAEWPLCVLLSFHLGLGATVARENTDIWEFCIFIC